MGILGSSIDETGVLTVVQILFSIPSMVRFVFAVRVVHQLSVLYAMKAAFYLLMEVNDGEVADLKDIAVGFHISHYIPMDD